MERATGGMSDLIRFVDHGRPGQRGSARGIMFSRHELNQLLSMYSRRVIKGEWRDYAIDFLGQMAVFSVFRHSQDRPLYAIAKCAPPSPQRSGDYVLYDGLRRVSRAPTINEIIRQVERRLEPVEG